MLVMNTEKVENESVIRIMALISKIRQKLISLGFSPGEVKLKVMQAMGKVYKLRCESAHSLEKIIMTKL